MAASQCAMNPLDAEQRGIRDGDVVRVFNDRGRSLRACDCPLRCGAELCRSRRGRGTTSLIWPIQKASKSMATRTRSRMKSVRPR